MQCTQWDAFKSTYLSLNEEINTCYSILISGYFNTQKKNIYTYENNKKHFGNINSIDNDRKERKGLLLWQNAHGSEANETCDSIIFKKNKNVFKI